MHPNHSRPVQHNSKASNTSLHKHVDTPSVQDLSKRLNPLPLQSQVYSQKPNLLKDKALYRFEREMNLTQFKELMVAFKEKSSQDGKLTIDEFKVEFAKILNSEMSEEQISLILMRIGIRGEFVTWDAFCNFMLLRAQDQSNGKESGDLQSNIFFPSKRLGLGRPLITPHKEMIIGFYHMESQQRYMTLSRDATLCYWSETFKLQKCFPNFIQTSHSPLLLDSSSTKRVSPHRPLNNPDQSNQVWVICVVYMPELKKWIFATDTHELLFYDYATHQLVAKMNLNSLALCIDYYHVKQSEQFNSEFSNADSILFVGDDQGEVIIMHFEADKLFQAFLLNSKKVLQLEKSSFSFVFKKKLHNDWVKQIHYDPNFKFLFSVSPDSKDSLVCGKYHSQKWRFVSSSVNKGINAFGLCNFPVALITGGADRKIRIWNPRRIANPQASLKGHLSPISDIQVNQNLGHFISISTDKIIKVWDIRSQICLQTLSTGYIHRPEDYLSFLSIVNQPDGTVRLFCGSSFLLEFLMEQTPTDSDKTSHPSAIRSVVCNPMCNMAISLCENSYIHVWDITTGHSIFKLGNKTIPHEITCIGLDSYSGYRRLLIGSGHGSIFLSSIEGHSICEMVQGDRREINCVLHVEASNGRFFVAGGWQCRIYVYTDEKDSETNVLTPYDIWTHPEDEENEYFVKADDITSMVFFPPDALIYSTFNGRLWVRSMTGSIVGELKVKRSNEPSELFQGSIDNLVVLPGQGEAQLASIHSEDSIHFWHLPSLTLVHTLTGHGASALCAFPNHLVCGTVQGHVLVWTLEGFPALSLVCEWQAHWMKSVTSVDTCMHQDERYMVTGGSDGQVRCWTLQGDLVGTFGDPAGWDMVDRATWRPLPYDFPQPPMANPSPVAQPATTLETRKRSLTSPLPSATSSASPFMTPRNNVHTADLLKRSHRSWFSKSQFAQDRIKKSLEEFRSPKKSFLNTVSTTDAKGIDIERVFHALPEYPLVELQSQTLPKLTSTTSSAKHGSPPSRSPTHKSSC